MTDDTVTIEINGVPHQARKGAMIIEVADAAGVRIPRFCYHEKLSVAANCRMCLVEVERAPKALPACATPVMDGMKVFTESEAAMKAQRSVMEFLLINHPLDCPICDQGGECELQDLAMGYGRGISRFSERKRVVPDKNLGPLIATDMTRCIHCTRCIRFGTEIAGLPELGATGRGEHMRIGTFVEQSVDSELSGNVIDVCPVGALTSKPFRFSARPWEMSQKESIACHDGVGSNLYLHVKGSVVKRVVPRGNEAVNEVWISDRDRFSYTGLYAGDRLATPRVKRDGLWYEVDWEEALEELAARLRAIDAGRLGTLVSPSATVEEHYLLQKMTRALGCANVDHRLGYGDCSDQEALPVYPSLGMPVDALEGLEAVLLVGTYPRKEHPLVNHRLRKAARSGASIMAIGPVAFEQNFEPGPMLLASPGAMVDGLREIASALAESGAHSVPEQASMLAGVEVSEAARGIASRLREAEGAAVLLGELAFAHPLASQLRTWSALVARLSGARLGYLAPGANAAGAALAGTLPHRGPGGVPVPRIGVAAGAQVAEGLDGYLLFNVEPELDLLSGAQSLPVLERAELVVSFTSFANEAMETYADVLLPIAQFAETDGTYVNLSGSWQSFGAAVPPPGEARPGWRILRVLGNVLGLDGFEHRDCEAVREELREQLAEPAGRNEDMVGALSAPEDGAGGEAIWRSGLRPMYSVDPLVRRAAPLQATAEAGRGAGIRMNGRTAGALGLARGQSARVVQEGRECVLPVHIDELVADHTVTIPPGLAETCTLGPPIGPVTVGLTGGEG